MALSKYQIAEIENAGNNFLFHKRPPEEIRKDVDYSYRIEKHSVTIIEKRPSWRDKDKIMESPIAKTTYVGTEGIWKIYWMRANMKWYLYDPHPFAREIGEFFDVVSKDSHGCFFG